MSRSEGLSSYPPLYVIRGLQVASGGLFLLASAAALAVIFTHISGGPQGLAHYLTHQGLFFTATLTPTIGVSLITFIVLSVLGKLSQRPLSQKSTKLPSKAPKSSPPPPLPKKTPDHEVRITSSETPPSPPSQNILSEEHPAVFTPSISIDPPPTQEKIFAPVSAVKPTSTKTDRENSKSPEEEKKLSLEKPTEVPTLEPESPEEEEIKETPLVEKTDPLPSMEDPNKNQPNDGSINETKKEELKPSSHIETATPIGTVVPLIVNQDPIIALQKEIIPFLEKHLYTLLTSLIHAHWYISKQQMPVATDPPELVRKFKVVEDCLKHVCAFFTKTLENPVFISSFLFRNIFDLTDEKEILNLHSMQKAGKDKEFLVDKAQKPGRYWTKLISQWFTEQANGNPYYEFCALVWSELAGNEKWNSLSQQSIKRMEPFLNTLASIKTNQDAIDSKREAVRKLYAFLITEIGFTDKSSKNLMQTLKSTCLEDKLLCKFLMDKFTRYASSLNLITLTDDQVTEFLKKMAPGPKFLSGAAAFIAKNSSKATKNAILQNKSPEVAARLTYCQDSEKEPLEKHIKAAMEIIHDTLLVDGIFAPMKKENRFRMTFLSIFEAIKKNILSLSQDKHPETVEETLPKIETLFTFIQKTINSKLA